MKTSIAFATFALAVTFAHAAAPPPAARLSSAVLDPTVMVRAGDRTLGTGVVIRHRGALHVLTAAHVAVHFKKVVRSQGVDEQGHHFKSETTWWEKVPVLDRLGRTRLCKVVAYDAGSDLALLRPDSDRGLVPARVAPDAVSPEPGEDCWVCGGAYFDWNLQKGVVNRPEAGGLVFVNANIWFGHSGSGLFVRRDRDYLLVGVVVKIVDLTPKAPGIATDLATVRKFLKASDAVQ